MFKEYLKYVSFSCSECQKYDVHSCVFCITVLCIHIQKASLCHYITSLSKANMSNFTWKKSTCSFVFWLGAAFHQTCILQHRCQSSYMAGFAVCNAASRISVSGFPEEWLSILVGLDGFHIYISPNIYLGSPNESGMFGIVRSSWLPLMQQMLCTHVEIYCAALLLGEYVCTVADFFG